ncbi:hypothetical protein [Clostridium estertheticum]|uniref:hypothetical protein n=1 Tax=Clostridium estertheticum TaxID=238834 RepID=UPI001CF4072E|nr:hypothetical protein [Clostridium estertheticum]MCB2357063.1 hypothetical protein [Clostridium estertheticum]WAG43942.1 hypothetical protein LL065_25350 [Clostridium estertheticum]
MNKFKAYIASILNDSIVTVEPAIDIREDSHNKLNILSILLFIIGFTPLLVTIFTQDSGNSQLKYIFGENIITTIPRFDELIFYIGMTLVGTSLTYQFAKKSFVRQLIVCEIIIILSMYFGDVLMIYPSGSGTFVNNIRTIVCTLLTVPNFICFFIIYKTSKNIKYSCLPGIIGAVTVVLSVISSQLNIVIYKGFNTGLGIENLPRAVVIIAMVNLIPVFLCTMVINAAKKVRSTREELV